MTTEQKAKAYDEALKRAMELQENSNGMIPKKWLWKVFPELAEPSDERTRKALLHLVNSNKELSFGIDNYDGVKWEDIIVWIEKQGEQKSIWHNEDEEPQRDSLILLIMQSGTPIVAKIIEPNHTFNHGERWAYIDDLLEKQGEQPKEATYTHEVETGNGNIKAMVTEKVQLPKFKVKYAGSEYNVLEIKESAGVTYYGIEDEPNHIDYVKAENCEIISGYAIKENGSPYPTKPAVFSEQKPQRMVSAEAKEALYDKPTDEEMKELLRTEYEKGRADTIAEMEKDWSEEDEVKINRIVACLENLNVADNDILLKDVDWLKSLKDRVIPKPKHEWSIEDERTIAIINNALTESNTPPDDYDKVYDWLESIKQRIGWKPSNAQIEALEHFVKSIGEGGYASPYDNNTKLLYSLLKQLKKLKA